MNSLPYEHERPLVVNPKIATAIGLNEAIVLQQLHFWIRKNERESRNYHDGKFWTYNGYREWKNTCFPFMSESTIKRTMLNLEKLGILESKQVNAKSYDQRKWYTINYDVVETIVVRFFDEEEKSDDGDVQSDLLDEVKLTQSERSDWSDITYNTSYKSNRIKSLNGFSDEKLDFSGSSSCVSTPFQQDILDRQILNACNSVGIVDDREYKNIRNVITYYYGLFTETFGYEHPRLSNKAMERVVSELISGIEELDMSLDDEYNVSAYKAIINQHFRTDYSGKCDYSISHFVSGNIRLYRYYEAIGL